ncbi:MAG: hypothetical protein ACI9JN_002511 [Bacteroidia bacterium]|jgi:hypothetical protein
MNHLKKYLIINSAFSSFSGILLIFAASSLNALFAISNTLILPFVGANLLVFSLFVYYVAVRQLKNKSLVNLITSLDLAWVIGSLIIVLGQLFSLSIIGYIIILVVSFWIGYLGWMQFKYNRQS